MTQTLNGTPGNDSLAGTDTGNPANPDGIDIINGLAGSDTLSGLGGNDILQGGAGADILNGGAGSDTASYSSSAAAVQVGLRTGTGAGGDAEGDTLTNIENIIGSAFADILRGDAGNNGITGGGGNDLINGFGGADALDGGAGIDTVAYSSSATGVTVDLAAGTGTGGDAQGDTLSGIESIVGSGFNDVFVASAAANFLAGGDGVDTVSYAQSTARVIVRLNEGRAFEGWAQGDTFSAETENLIGSAFNDILTGNGNDAPINILDGGAGDDALAGDGATGAGGADTLIGGAGIDTAYYDNVGGAVQVSLTTGTGKGFQAEGDTLSGIENLVGGRGGDTLTGEGGSNRLDGGDGSDVLAGEGGADTLIGGAGFDTAWYGRSAAGVQVDLTTGTGTGGDAQGDTLNGIEFVVGSGFDDILTGNNVGNSMSGGGGNDLINGGRDADFLDGGAGIDTAKYDGSARAVTIDLASGRGLGGEAEGDVLAGIENLTGSAFADRLYGAAGANALSGGDGDDTLRGGADADVLDGGAGSDFANYQGSTAAVSVNLLTGVTSGGDAAGDTLTGIENLYGSSNADQLTGDNARNIIGGELGDDALAGNGGDDALSGEAGDDVLSGGDGNDRLVGGAGVDTIHGGTGTGNDSIDAGSENDEVFGEAGQDSIYGGAGDDRIDGGDGNDILEGDGGADTLTGGAGIDTASYAGSAAGVSVNLATGVVSGGDAAGDTLTGIEQVLGSAFTDTLTGDANANTLWGMAGDDVLTGGGSGDALKGGAGNDRFVYTALSDSAVSGLGKDAILDFSTGDKIDLSAIDANGAGPGNGAFTFGTGDFTRTAGELRVVTAGSVQVVYADVNGDKVPDFAINVISDHALTAADFVL